MSTILTKNNRKTWNMKKWVARNVVIPICWKHKITHQSIIGDIRHLNSITAFVIRERLLNAIIWNFTLKINVLTTYRIELFSKRINMILNAHVKHFHIVRTWLILVLYRHFFTCCKSSWNTFMPIVFISFHKKRKENCKIDMVIHNGSLSIPCDLRCSLAFLSVI